MGGLRKTTRAAILEAKPDTAIGLLRKLVRERTSDEFENAFQITATRGRYTIVFPMSNGQSKITRPNLTRLQVLDFVAGLEKDR